MVFDATAKAFSFSESADDCSSHASTSTTALPAPPSTTTRPVKRRRTTQSGTMSSTPTPSPAPTPVVDLDALDAARRRAAGRVMTLWESLAEKYARAIDEDDEIDILTGKICRDRGVLRSVSERGWKIGSFGEALEVEPLVLVSEGETETGASEADDEGEGEDDTEGEGVEDKEEGEEDPLGDWSYDWQYRALPPPRPELSPQDAEDLKEFLAAENAIQESLRKNEKQPELEDDDDVVYLGDSLHNTDGTLRADETSDDEFASMVMTDNSTIRYMKHEDEDEVDDVEPMASILGALALGRTPKKQSFHPPSPRSKDEEIHSKDFSMSDASPNCPDDGHQVIVMHSSTGTSNTSGISGLDVDDDLIIIDSDSDDEPELTNDSGLKPGIPPSSPSKPISHSTNASTSNARSEFVSLGVSTTPGSGSGTHNRSLVAQSRPTKVSATSASTLSDPPVAQTSPPNIKRVPSPLPGSPAPKPVATKKCAPKHGLGRLTPRSQTLRPSTATVNRHLQASMPDSRSSKAIASTPTKKESNLVPQTGPRLKSPNKKLHEVQTPVKPTKPKAITPDTGVREKPALSQDVTAYLGPSPKADASSSEVPISTPTASPSSLTKSKSPAKRRKKATVVEVVLPVSRKALKVKRESTAPPLATSKDTALTKATTASNERSHLQPNESASGSEPLGSTLGATHPVTPTSLVVRSGVDLGLKRKRSLDGSELTGSANNALESRTSVESVGLRPGPLHVCCPSAQLGTNQPAPCCSTHSQYHPGPHSHTQNPHSAHTSCSTHHHLGIPVYQHQHQHQHLHTHLPYPLPQLPYTANELTEAAFKLIHGLSTFHQVPGASGSSGTSFWLPGAQIPFGFAIPSQAGPSSQTLAPKMEEPPSQEKISNECIPSSQEHERKTEATSNLGDEKPNQIFPPLPQLEEPGSAGQDPLFETHMEGQTITTSTLTLSSSNPKLPPPEREMSVIDIESDSDDELAVCDAGAGSMRWEPPVKKEADTAIGEGFKRQPSPIKSSTHGRASSRTSPVKLRRMP